MRRSARLLVAILLLGAAQGAFALKEERRAEVREQIRSVRVWELTRELGLSEQQARAFFPAEREYEERLEELRAERGEVEAEMEARLRENRKDDRELLVHLERLRQIDKRISVHEQEFERKVGRILRPEQRVRYELFEKQFEGRLKQMIQEIQRGELAPGSLWDKEYRDSLLARERGSKQMRKPDRSTRQPEKRPQEKRPSKSDEKRSDGKVKKSPSKESDEKRPSRDGRSKNDRNPSKQDRPRGKRG